MPGMTREKTAYLEHEAAVPLVREPANGSVENIIANAMKSLDQPLRLFGSFPAYDSKLNINPSKILNGDGTTKSVSTVGSVIPTFPTSSIDFQTGAVVGGPVSITLPAGTVGQFRRCAFSLDSTGTLQAVFSAEFALIGSLPDPSTLFVANAQPVGWIDLECTNVVGRYKTAGSATDIIENFVGGNSRIFMFGAGAGGGSSTPTAGVAQTFPIPMGVTEIEVTFPFPFTGPNYVVLPVLENLVDPDPDFISIVTFEKTGAGFKAKWNAPTETANYAISYIVPVLQLAPGEVEIPFDVTELEVDLPFSLPGAMYAVIPEFVNLVDSDPDFQPMMIVQKTNLKFKAKWNAPTDTANYRLAFHVAQHT